MSFSLPLACSISRTLRPSYLAIKTQCLKLVIITTGPAPPLPSVPNMIAKANFPRLFTKLSPSTPSPSRSSPYKIKPDAMDNAVPDPIPTTDEDVLAENYGSPFLIEGSEFFAVVNEDSDDGGSLYVRVDMPGVSKEGVKLWLDRTSTLHVQGQEAKQEADEFDREDESEFRKYETDLFLDPGYYKLDQIKARMKDGVLKILVPKVKVEDKPGVLLLKVN